MTLLGLVVVLIVVGVLLWLVGMIPMDATIQKILRVVVIIAVVLWLLQAFGLLPALSSVRVR